MDFGNLEFLKIEVKRLEITCLLGFDDKGCDKGFGEYKVGILVDFSWEFGICGEVKI